MDDYRLYYISIMIYNINTVNHIGDDDDDGDGDGTGHYYSDILIINQLSLQY